MDLFNRLVVTVLSLLLAAGGIMVSMAVGGGLPPSLPQQQPQLAPLLEWLQGLPPPYPYWSVVGGAALAAVALLVLYLEVRPPARSPALLVSRDERGTVTVSMPGLRRLAEHVARTQPGVENAEARARVSGAGVAFMCRVLVAPQVSTPELAARIREELSATVERHTGRPASRIDVHVVVREEAAVRRLPRERSA